MVHQNATSLLFLMSWELGLPSYTEDGRKLGWSQFSPVLKISIQKNKLMAIKALKGHI